jgi:Cys-Gly metallodipeptidase DUG1
VRGPAKDLHSGKFGGAVHEPMIDLVHVLGSLVEAGTGAILVPGINDSVAPLTPEESALYDGIDFDLPSLRKTAAVPSLLHEAGGTKAALMHMWRYPSLSVHGVALIEQHCRAQHTRDRRALGRPE